MAIMKVTATSEIVTDVVLLNVLAEQGIDKDYVKFVQDYSLTNAHTKFYRDIKSQRRFAVVSQLPMVMPDGRYILPAWEYLNGSWVSRNNLFSIVVTNKMSLTCLYDQPSGTKAGARVVYAPQIFIDNKESKPKNIYPEWLEVDPVNPNYHQNVLEWDYGICKRRLRIIEGSLLGSWVFPANPGGDVRIKYNQAGDFRLKLGQFAVSDDEEQIPAGAFKSPMGGYPFTVSDGFTFYPDANPETTSVDGDVRRVTTAESWATLKSGAGTSPLGDSNVNMYCYMSSYSTTDTWRWLMRSIMLFDTSPFSDNVVISGAVLSVYCQAKFDQLGLHATYAPNIYSSNPASNTALVAADYGTLGATAFAAAIGYDSISTGAYIDFSLNASGIAAISKTGVSKFGLRDSYYDAGSNTPGWPGASMEDTGVKWYTADQGAGYKPKLVVTYTVFTEAVWDFFTWG